MKKIIQYFQKKVVGSILKIMKLRSRPTLQLLLTVAARHFGENG